MPTWAWIIVTLGVGDLCFLLGATLRRKGQIDPQVLLLRAMHKNQAVTAYELRKGTYYVFANIAEVSRHLAELRARGLVHILLSDDDSEVRYLLSDTGDEVRYELR